jgi:alpha-L-fucosidase 2
MSANFGFYPGHSITLRGNPELAAAIRKWLEPRQARTGWNSAWDICDWARLEDGAAVDTVIRDFFRIRTPPPGLQRPAGQAPGAGARPPGAAGMLPRGIGNNLHNTGSNQSDANFGFTACVAESLLQSHAGEISLLPALPVSWRNGSVEGLRARGGFEVDITWKDGVLLEAKIVSILGKPFTVRYGGVTRSYELAAGQSMRLTAGDLRMP